MAWIGGSAKAIQIVWYVALGILITGLLIRDGYQAVPRKRLLGLRLVTRRRRMRLRRSIVRNIPLVILGWNVVEAVLG